MHRKAVHLHIYFLRLFGRAGAALAAGFAGAFRAGAFGGAFLAGAGFFPGALGGAAVVRGGTARIRHLGPEPIRSSRWAFKSASFTK